MSVLGGQQELLDAIAAYELRTRQQPTVRELAAAMGCGSSTAHQRIQDAVKAGVIEYTPGIPRSIRVKGEPCPMCGR